MTAVLLQPKCWGMDAASFRRFTDFGRVKAVGSDWVSLYVDGNYGVNRDVVEAAWAAGLVVMLNFELSDQAAKNGYSQGVAHAKRAMSSSAALGFEGEAPLIFSGADFNPTAEQMPAVLDYHRALVDTYTLGIGGAYGPYRVLEPLSRQSWWPDDWPLWHWGGDGKTLYPWAWVKQGPGGSYFNPTVGFNVDNNLLLKPMKFWAGYGKPYVPDVIPEDDMAKLTLFPCSDADAVFVGMFDGEQVHTVTHCTWEDVEHYKADGVPIFGTSIGGFKWVTLLGDLPAMGSDSRHEWTGAEFRRVVGEGTPGKDGKDAPIPRSFTPVYD